MDIALGHATLSFGDDLDSSGGQLEVVLEQDN